MSLLDQPNNFAWDEEYILDVDVDAVVRDSASIQEYEIFVFRNDQHRVAFSDNHAWVVGVAVIHFYCCAFSFKRSLCIVVELFCRFIQINAPNTRTYFAYIRVVNRSGDPFITGR